jgi:ESX secretion system ATPase EccB
MQTRRDHMHAYHFAVSRLSTALTGADPGTGEAPFRRAALGAMMGAGLAILVSVGAVIFGWLDPAASTAWRQSGALVVEKETGTRFIYFGGVLHPTLNYTSARLLAGQSATLNYMPRKALAGVPVGTVLGIPGAPDSLPTTMLPGRWSLCLAPARPDGLTLDFRGGRASSLGRARALVSSPAGPDYVIWDSTKYPLPQPSGLVALGFGNSVPIPAPASWLDALPTGRALIPPAVPRAGRPAPAVAGRPARVGALFDSLSGGVDQYYVALSDGLAPISRTEFTLMAAAPGAAAPTQVTPAEIAASPVSANGGLLGQLPNLLPGSLYQPAVSGTTLCVREVSPGRPGRGSVVTEPGSRSAVLIPRNAGLLVAPPAPSGSLSISAQSYLITGSGLKYPLGRQAPSLLGYSGQDVRVVPAAILQLLPDGPLLSSAMARQVVPWG